MRHDTRIIFSLASLLSTSDAYQPYPLLSAKLSKIFPEEIFIMLNVLCRIPNHVGDCCMALPGLRLLEASGLTPVLTGKRWAEDLLAGTGWRFEPIEGHVTEDLGRIRNIARRWGEHPKGLLFPNSLSSALLYRIGGIRSAGFPTDFRRILLDTVVPEPNTVVHEVERFFILAHEALEALQ